MSNNCTVFKEGCGIYKVFINLEPQKARKVKELKKFEVYFYRKRRRQNWNKKFVKWFCHLLLSD